MQTSDTELTIAMVKTKKKWLCLVACVFSGQSTLKDRSRVHRLLRNLVLHQGGRKKHQQPNRLAFYRIESSHRPHLRQLSKTMRSFKYLLAAAMVMVHTVQVHSFLPTLVTSARVLSKFAGKPLSVAATRHRTGRMAVLRTVAQAGGEETKRKPKVAVVGAGWGGWAAAKALCENNCEVL
jgi:hypothetical protein